MRHVAKTASTTPDGVPGNHEISQKKRDFFADFNASHELKLVRSQFVAHAHRRGR